jgi:hypothetical protein
MLVFFGGVGDVGFVPGGMVSVRVGVWMVCATVWPPGKGFVTAVDLASAWRVPIPIATQYLDRAEQATAVCRDDTVRGLRFYPNKFLHP